MRSIRRRLGFLVLILSASFQTALGQQAQVDSLTKLLETRFSEPDSRRIDVLAETAELLLRIDPQRSLQLSKEALRLSITTGYQEQISHIYNNTGTNRLKGSLVRPSRFITRP